MDTKGEIYGQFTTRTANLIINEIGSSHPLFLGLAELKSFVQSDPRKAVTALARVPGMGTKSIAEIHVWATGDPVPRSQGSVVREQQRKSARNDRITRLREQIGRAKDKIAEWEKQLASLERE